MKKIYLSVLYMVLHPMRALEIIKLYRLLQGKYRLKVILSHSYKEAFYKKKDFIKNNLTIAEDRQSNNLIENQQIIICMHDGLLHSGGLTDRLKGISTLYMFARNQEFDFKIYFTSPFDLKKYLQPNDYDWTIEEDQISYNLNTTALYTWENEKFADEFFKVNMKKQQLHISCNSGECSPIYSDLFHELFKPSAFLNTKIEFHKEKLGGDGNYISISLRFQNLLGEFEEGNSTPLSEKKREQLIEKCLNAINKLKNQNNDIEKILLTSDSNFFREIATTSYSFIYTYILPEETGHIDYAVAGKGKELTAFLDMFLISRAKKAYQIRDAKMYNSDFPNMAAKINNIPYEMIVID